MHKVEEWNRRYEDIAKQEFVPIPPYDLAVLTTPLSELLLHRTEENEEKLTAKLYYSTRHFGSYDLDTGEYTGDHPGVDLKVPMGTPIGAIAGGRVQAVRRDERLGMHVLVKHRVPEEGSLVSIYGHLGEVRVKVGEDLKPGDIIGIVGLTGNTRQPHLHLQIDKFRGGGEHKPYWPAPEEHAATRERFTVHPMIFLQRYAHATATIQAGGSRAASEMARVGMTHAAASTLRASPQGSQRSAE